MFKKQLFYAEKTPFPPGYRVEILMKRTRDIILLNFINKFSVET